MEKAGWASKSFLIDGFPRNEDNYQGYQNVLGTLTNVEKVLFFDCPEETLIQRILQRAETSGRVDDNIESLKKRLVVF